MSGHRRIRPSKSRQAEEFHNEHAAQSQSSARTQSVDAGRSGAPARHSLEGVQLLERQPARGRVVVGPRLVDGAVAVPVPIARGIPRRSRRGVCQALLNVSRSPAERQGRAAAHVLFMGRSRPCSEQAPWASARSLAGERRCGGGLTAAWTCPSRKGPAPPWPCRPARPAARCPCTAARISRTRTRRPGNQAGCR